jgi:Fe-S-cluster containining protein
MNNKDIAGIYIDLTHLIQQEFNRNIQKYGDKIKCRKGCSQCCSQIFRITRFDAFVLKDHINKLPENIKISLRKKANVYIENLQREDLDGDYFRKPDFACPALNDEGACLIYEARPVICRRFGPPVFDYKKPNTLFACELNFANGEEISDDKLIPNQTKIGIAWDELKTEFNTRFNLDEHASTTIAEAILES